MSDDSRSTAIAGPRHLVAGNYRKGAALLVLAGLATPVVTIPLAALVFVLIGMPVPGLLAMLGFLSMPLCWPAFRVYVALVWWRGMWWWDARAGLLAANAERGLFSHDAGAVDADHCVVAPWVSSIDLTPSGRTYMVRPLPGQTLAHYVEACPRLAARWGAAAVVAEMLPGTRTVRLDVLLRLPAPTPWKPTR